MSHSTLFSNLLVADRRMKRRRSRGSGRGSGLVAASIAAWGLTLMSGLFADCASATSTPNFHVPTVTNFCGNPTAIVTVTICNTYEFLASYDIYLADEGVVYDCEDSAVPPHTFLDSSNVLVGPGTCKTVQIEVSRPDELDSVNSLCYWVVIESTPGGVSHLGATLRDQELLCFDWYFEEPAVFIHPSEPVTIEADIYNFTAEPADLLLLYESWDGEGAPDDFVISINGEEPGSTIFGPLFVPEGGFSTLSLDVEWTQPGLTGFRDLVLVREDTFEPVASIGLGNVPQVPAGVDDPLGPKPELGVMSFVEIKTTPNPFRSSCSIQLRVAEAVESASAVVVDALGRRQATLFPTRALPEGDFRLDWDGSDDAGRALPAGIYWIEVRSDDGRVARPMVKAR